MRILLAIILSLAALAIIGAIRGAGSGPITKTLEVFRLQPEGYLLVKTFRGKTAKAEPFTELVVPLSRLWIMKV